MDLIWTLVPMPAFHVIAHVVYEIAVHELSARAIWLNLAKEQLENAQQVLFLIQMPVIAKVVMNFA